MSWAVQISRDTEITVDRAQGKCVIVTVSSASVEIKVWLSAEQARRIAESIVHAADDAEEVQ
jgi:hypothetical protein